MDMNEFQALSRRTIPPSKPERDLLANFALGLCGEAGEVSEPIKKYLFHDKALSLADLAEEIGDVLFYVAGICSVLGLKLEDVAAGNVRKLEARYPSGWPDPVRNVLETAAARDLVERVTFEPRLPVDANGSPSTDCPRCYGDGFPVCACELDGDVLG